MSNDIVKDGANDEIVCEEFCEHTDAIEETKSLMPSDEELFRLAEVFKIFGDSTRIRIICALMHTELCVCDLAELLGMGQSAVSHQLRLLRTNRLVKTRRDGKSIFYSLDDGHIGEIINAGLTHITEE